jgi:hypothetical protein
MNWLRILAGVGYRLTLVLPLAFVVAVLIQAATRDSRNDSFAELIKAIIYAYPGAHALSFVGAVAWFLASNPKPWFYHGAIFLASQLYFSMAYLLWLKQMKGAVNIGMPIFAIIIIGALFMAKDQIFAGHQLSKILITLGVLGHMAGYMMLVVGLGLEKGIYYSIVFFFVACINLEVGWWKGIRAEEEQATTTVYLGKSVEEGIAYQYQQPTYGSVQIITTQ